MNTNISKVHPQVDAVIRPIIEDMTRIDKVQKMNPIFGPHNEPENIKELKKSCVHMVYEDGVPQLSIRKNNEGELVCRVCGRVIYTKFDKSSVQRIMDCIEVLNQVLLFGMINGLKAEPIKTIIDCKRVLPSIAQLAKNMNEYVSRENSSSETESNIGLEYGYNNQFKPITG